MFLKNLFASRRWIIDEQARNRSVRSNRCIATASTSCCRLFLLSSSTYYAAYCSPACSSCNFTCLVKVSSECAHAQPRRKFPSTPSPCAPFWNINTSFPKRLILYAESPPHRVRARPIVARRVSQNCPLSANVHERSAFNNLKNFGNYRAAEFRRH